MPTRVAQSTAPSTALTRFEPLASHDLLLSASFDPASVSLNPASPSGRRRRRATVRPDDALAHLVASSRLVVPVTSAAAAQRALHPRRARRPRSILTLFAQRVADCHRLVSLLTTAAAAAACQQWTFTLDGACRDGRAAALRAARRLVHSRAAALFAGGAAAPAARLELTDGRAALQKLLGRVGMAPVRRRRSASSTPPSASSRFTADLEGQTATVRQ